MVFYDISTRQLHSCLKCLFSVSKMKEKYTQRIVVNQDNIDYLVGRGFSSTAARLMTSRGVTADNLQSYVSNDLVRHDPFLMPNMREAVEVISCAMENDSSILIYGDYDADGLTASSILYLFFTDNGVDCDVLIPTREEGYGVHADKVVKAFQNKYYDLIITVDCGISNIDEVAAIQDQLGVEVIVTDHHELPNLLPDCICVNPKMGYPFTSLAGAGVAWKLVEALTNFETATKYSDLACVGTVGDIMPLIDENRTIVNLGLKRKTHKGLLKLAELSKCDKQLSCSDVAMRIVPRINAAGRIGDPLAALKVLLCRDKVDVEKVDRLIELNELRKRTLDDIVAMAESQCDANLIAQERMVFLCGDDWHRGVLGIVASRFKEKYNVPAIIMSKVGDEYVGSARGVDGIDLFEAFNSAKDCLNRFGGHKASVGFSVSADNLLSLKSQLTDYFKQFDESNFVKKYYYDVEIGIDGTAEELWEISEFLQPLLPQDKVVCRIRGTVKYANSFGRDLSHVSITLDNGLELKGFFKYAKVAALIKNGANIDAIITLDFDSYRKTTCGIIEDLTLCNSLCFDEFYKLNLLQNFTPKSEVAFVTSSELDSILQGESVCVIFDNYEEFLHYERLFDFSLFELNQFFVGDAFRQVVVSPLNDQCFDRFETVLVFADERIIRKFSAKNVLYFKSEISNDIVNQIVLSREVCSNVYLALKNKSKFDSLRGVYDKYLMSKMTYEQFCLAVRVFEELGIMSVTDRCTVAIDSSQKRNLVDSSIYSMFATE